MKRSLLVFAFLVFSIARVSAQYAGFPIKNYSPAEYNASPQCWSILQDTSGLMYFGSSTFLLEYDGESFRKIFIQKSAAVRSLGIDSKGRIYVASVGNFGYLEKDPFGGNEFVSLLPLVPENHRSFSDVWKIHVIRDTVIFQTNEKIFIYDQKNITAIEHKFPFASISFKAADKFLVRVKSRGLHILKNGKLELMPGTEMFADEPVFGVIEDKSDPGALTVLTATKGFYRYRMNCEVNCLEKINASSDQSMINAGVLGMGWLNDSVIAVHSRTGLYLLNTSLQLQDVINKQSGLADETMSAFFTDRNGQTWLALNNGLGKVSLSSPFYYYTEKSGLNGVLESSARDGNYLYVGSTSGVYYAILKDTVFRETFLNNKLEFRLVEGVRVEGWNFHRHNGNVFVATSDGVFRLDKGKAERITNSYTSVVSGSFIKDRLYFGQKDGLAVFDLSDLKNPRRKFFYPFSEDILHVAEVSPDNGNTGDLWLSTRFNGLIRFNINGDIDPVYQRYDTLNGVPAGNIIPVRKNNDLYFFHSAGAFTYNRKKDKGQRSDQCFEPIAAFDQIGISDIRYWELQYNREFTREQFRELEIFDKSISRIVPDKNMVSWMCVGDKLVRFNGKFTGGHSASFNTMIRMISAKDSLIDHGVIRNNDAGKELAYRFNNLKFSFASNWFDHEEATQFRWRLVGFDTTWSEWSYVSAKEYTNLAEGDYILEVQAMNLYGEAGKTAAWSFSISPPWYRTGIALLAYILVFIGVILLAVKLSVMQLQKAKVRLESLVTERTAEVVKQRDLVEHKNSLLELAHKDISDSISYASRIQQAILPADSELRESFKDHFVLFQPRDVVSGDFYWHAKYDDLTFIAAADCTGHGVPGALMSMIGNTLLNEIIVSKKISDPGEILSQLDIGVKRALKQLTGETESNDGMDIALCSYESKSRKLRYAGANRPLFAFKDGDFIEVKADKKPVGGAFYQGGAFTSNTVELGENAMVYMFSDGYHDQFGGPDGKKFMVKRMKQLLSKIHVHSCSDQKNMLSESLKQWKGELGQIDDVLVVGIRL